MALRKFNPITPGMRHKVLSKFEEITADKPHKPLLEPIKKSGGRNSDGKMTMRYRGGDASDVFARVHQAGTLEKFEKLRVGVQSPARG